MKYFIKILRKTVTGYEFSFLINGNFKMGHYFLNINKKTHSSVNVLEDICIYSKQMTNKNLKRIH